MRSIFSYWNISAANAIVVLLLCALYLLAVKFRFSKRSFYFLAALCVIVICIVSPLHFLGEHYLFSAHMLSHVLLLLVAGPLVVAAIPNKNSFKKGLLLFSKRTFKTPLLPWLAGVSIMWIWHVPFIFYHLVSMHGAENSSAGMQLLMAFHTASLLFAGIIFSWPLINPYKQYRLGSLTPVLYLSSACVFCSLLGLLITFAPAGTYTRYITGNDVNGILHVIRNGWNLSASADQQIGGLIMWVPCCFIYLTASMLILIKWFGEKEIKHSITTAFTEGMGNNIKR